MEEKKQLLEKFYSSKQVIDQMRPIENRRNELQNKVTQGESRRHGCINLIFLVWFSATLMIFIPIVFNSDDSSLASKIELLAGFIILLNVIPIIWFIASIIKIIVLKIWKKEIKRKDDELNIIRQNKELEWLPFIYRTSPAFDSFYMYLSTGRADTLKEAMNIFETELNAQRMGTAAAIGAFYGAQQ